MWRDGEEAMVNAVKLLATHVLKFLYVYFGRWAAHYADDIATVTNARTIASVSLWFLNVRMHEAQGSEANAYLATLLCVA